MQYVRWFEQLGLADLEHVGGKNASLGEMLNHLSRAGVKVPPGFATTADAYWEFLQQNQLDTKINQCLDGLDIENIQALNQAGSQIRQWILEASFSPHFIDAISQAWETLQKGQTFSVAVRSSATAEDLPDASFAGQQETFLHINGLDNVLQAIKHVFASLFNDRAITYRVHHGFNHQQVALSAGIQKMVRSDQGASGVMFTLDTESGFDQVVLINASYGLGELVVQGAVTPDEFYVYKRNLDKKIPAVLRRTLGSKKQRMVYAEGQHSLSKTVEIRDVELADQQRYCLSEEDIQHLAMQALLIERHYQRPMDIEWAKDGVDGHLYILQARPETVQSRQKKWMMEHYHLQQKGTVLTQGRSIGQKIGQGMARVINDVTDMDQVQPGDVLVTDMTDPDWEPVMKRAAAIVTNRGGRTCHAAIIARELGIPAVVGCGDATVQITPGQAVTVSCAEGDTGFVYRDLLPFERREIDVGNMPKLPFKIMMNVGNPDRAFDFQRLPHAGVGLARLEFIINRMIGIHPKALLEYDTLSQDLRQQIQAKIAAYASPIDYYVDRLAEGIATIAASFHPHPVIVRLSDFKSNEYANLLGGDEYEPHEENPMLGFRGASRYVAESFNDCFALECKAVSKVRDEMQLTNVEVMIPFVRTLGEAQRVIEVLKQQGLERGTNGLRIIMMCELPSNAILAEQFLQYFDGFSIGSNDMTQLTLGLDRDSGLVAEQFDERDPAVKALLQQAIQACKKAGKYVGICGQGPSDHPDLARWLMEQGIDSVSLNPDSVLETWLLLAQPPAG
jgi:pyruvate, water dikinase